MSLVLAGKIFGGVVFTGGSATLIILMMMSHSYVALGTETINIYATNLTAAKSNTYEELKHENTSAKTNRNFLCKFSNVYYECTISAVNDFDASKKWLDIKGLEKTNSQDITKTNFETANKIFRIEINESITDWNKNNGTINLVTKDKQNTYISLKTLFALNKAKTDVDQYTKTQYFVIKGVDVQSQNSTATNSGGTVGTTYDVECTTSSKTITNETASKCEIYKLQSTDVTDLTSLNFAKTNTKTNVEIAQNKYYLVDLKDQTKNKADSAHMKIKQTITTITSASGGSTTNNKTITTKTVTLNDQSGNEIFAAVYLNDAKDKIFILKNK